jgi:hypothetical protein
MDFNDDFLQGLTRDYWDRWKDAGANANALLREYIGGDIGDGISLMHAEMLRAHARIPTRPGETLTLALSVGYSIEPLLQALYAYQPTRVILLLNQQYLALTKGENGDRGTINRDDFGRIVTKAICFLTEQTWYRERAQQFNRSLECVDGTSPNIQLVPIKQATPSYAFQAILTHLRDASNPLVDITGAKKSIVAGAFFYAAFANVPVTYVDFDDTLFDPEYGKPYGYACQIGTVANPYQDFALRDLGRVRALYRQDNFLAAEKILAEILQAIKKGETLLSDDQRQSLDLLSAKLSAYALWNNGDFYHAKIEMQRLGMAMPTAVELLGEDWQTEHSTIDAIKRAEKIQFGMTPPDQPNPPNSIFLNLDQLVAYCDDEYAKLERLIKPYEDFRSALLRAAGLSEVLLKARFAILWYKGWLHYFEDKHLQHECLPTASDMPRLFKELVKHTRVEWMISVLQNGHDKSDRVKEFFVRIDSPPAPRLATFWNDKLQPKDLAELRNKAIHVCLYINEQLAQAAVDLARANLTEFKTHWASLLGTSPMPIVTRALTWQELCKQCGVDHFLPPNLLQED